MPVYNITQYSYRLALVPDALQGRVNAVSRLVAFGAQPLGLALTGVLLQAYGPITTVLLLWLPQLVLAVIATRSRVLHRARPLADVQRG